MVQYLAHYMPDVSAYTTLLLGCMHNNHPFERTPWLDMCLQSIKTLACKDPILCLVFCKAQLLPQLSQSQAAKSQAGSGQNCHEAGR